MRLRLPRAVRLGVVLAAFAAVVAVPAGGQVGTGGLAGASAAVDQDAFAAGPVMLELAGPPSAVVYANEKSSGATEAAAAAASKEQKQENEAAQQPVVNAVGNDFLYSVQTAYNGVAVSADGPADLARYAELPGVTGVHPIPLAELQNASSVGFIGAHQAWQAFGATGEGMTIAVIDTGIDYVHTGFGGTGSAADLATAKNPANNVENPDHTAPFSIPGIYPTAKVVGGHDLVGDAYNAGAAAGSPALVPHPDRNPMDCNGHGSHVAGTAAGNGVNADGTTYTGPYDASVPAETMRIGPGVAPEAEIIFYRVFGCVGSTAVTAQAIDMAVDPNGDGNPADHVDVINMSLGAAFGTADDPSAAASQNAALNDVIVVAAAGNDSDFYYITGSPSTSTRTISVASSTDPVDVTDAFRVNSPASIAGLHGASRSQGYAWLNPVSPPATVIVPITRDLFIPSVANRFGCNPYTGADLTGAAGKIVLVDWKVGNDPFPCGSAVRADHAANAGAHGVIMADSVPYLDTAIAGNNRIPAMYTTSTVGDALKGAFASAGSVSITLSAEWINSTKIVTPGRGDMLSGFSSRGPRARGALLKPDIAAPGQGIFSVDNDTLSLGFSNQGTSMASPHVAGMMALLRAAHPTWSVEHLKALAMNTAGHDIFTGLGGTGDRYGVARVGAGRADVPAALGNQVVAFDRNGVGAVSVSFGALEVEGRDSWERTVRVVNHGSSTKTYTKSLSLRTDIPGVSYSFPGSSTVRVRGGDSETFKVRLTARASQMQNTRDVTVPESNVGFPRHYLSEESGLIMLTPQGGGTTLRVPVYANARPASEMEADDDELRFRSNEVTRNIELEGDDVNTGVEPLGWISKVSAFELQAKSPKATLATGVSELARNADIRHVGVALNAARNELYFGISSWGEWATPATDMQFSVQFDFDRNGTVDRTLFNTRFTGSDVFVTAVAAAQDFTNVFAANVNTAPFDNDVVVLPALIGPGGAAIPATTTRFNYRVLGLSRFWGQVDQTDWVTYDITAPGLTFTGGLAGTPMFLDLDDEEITVGWNRAAYAANASQGVLLLHHMNEQGDRAEIVEVEEAKKSKKKDDDDD